MQNSLLVSPKLFNKNLILLIFCQGLFLVNNVTFIAINGLVGLMLAPKFWMATLPAMGYVVGGALSTTLVAYVHKNKGRKASFQIGLLVAVISALICAYAAYSKNFWLLCFGTLVAGYYSANGQLYRFVAAELSANEFKEKAISWVLAGGILGAIIGPNLTSWTQNYFSVRFLGGYLALCVAGMIGLILIRLIDFTSVNQEEVSLEVNRSIWEIMSQPVFVVSAICASLGYGVMNLLMSASPLAMQTCGLPFENTVLALEFHVIGMFAPGFFTGSLIRRFGTLPIMGLGVLLNLVCIFIATTSQDFVNFFFSLLLLGVGWNFLFTGGTTLAMKAYRPEEKDKTQGALNFIVFGIMAFSSFGSGALVTTRGWTWLNYSSIIPVLIAGASIFWLYVYGAKRGLKY